MTVKDNLKRQLIDSKKTIAALQQELAETNRGLLALNLELESRVDERTAELHIAQEELQRTNSELLQLTLELEDRVSERTEELRESEREVGTLNAELEKRVIQRTAQLESVNKDLEAFAYSVSHDLRAPLRHIVSFIELLRERMSATLDSESLRFFNIISDEATRMGALIDDLLKFSRLGRTEIQKGQVDFKTLVQEAIQEMEPETRGRNVVWQIGDLPFILCDRSMFRLVWINLISNALKYTRPREQTKITIGCTTDVNGENVFFIRDNGVGFDMKYADKLFGVFQRLHRADEFEGTGIGLANVKQIINKHGGRVWSEAAPNAGAAFYFSLPNG
jgi:light-regulated signal transduction histidine kinase (bacteriophytochrome)